MSKTELIKRPKRRWKKDLLFFVILSILTSSSFLFFSYVERNSQNTIFRIFNVEYLESHNSREGSIEGSKYITKDMKLRFECNIPIGTKEVWVKLDEKTDWIQLDRTESFVLTSKNPNLIGVFKIFLRCDNLILDFTTTIYKQDLPTVMIYCSSGITTRSEKCTTIIYPVSYDPSQDSWAKREMSATIRARNSSNGYILELVNNEKLLNMREDDDWLLLPSKDIASALRTKFALDTYNSLNELDPLCKISHAEPIDLYLNYQYMGLYLLVERMDRKLFDLKDNLDSMIFKSEDWKGDFYPKTSNNRWEQIFPIDEDYNEYPLLLESFVQTVTDKEFFDDQSGIFSKTNREQLIDFLLFGLLVGHNSLEGFKYYIVQNSEYNSQFYFTPWDFDMSWGFSGEDILPFNYWLNNETNNIGFVNWNYLIYRLLFPENESLNRQFINDVKNRWSELRKEIWATENLKKNFINSFNLMRLGLLRSNNEEPINFISSSILNWIDKRFEIIDKISFRSFSVDRNVKKNLTIGIHGKSFTISRSLRWDCILPNDTIRAQYKINGTRNWTDVSSLPNFSICCYKNLKIGVYNLSIRYSNNLIFWSDQFSFITQIISSKLPFLFINCEDNIDKYGYRNCSIEFFQTNPWHRRGPINSQIKFRGNLVLDPKKGYRLQLSQNEPLFGMRDDDDWQLFASYLDHTRMRTKLAFDLWRSLLPSNPTAILPKSKYVALYINHEFQGLYLLSEKQDRRLFILDDAQNNLNSSLILQTRSGYENFRDMGVWEQDYPNIEDGINISYQIMENLIHFINNTSDTEFFNENTGIFSKFDKMNLIDFYLFNFFILHKDFWNKNYYLVRNSMPSKFFLIPWDFDGSFGQFGWLKYEPNSTVYFRNLLLQRLLNNKEFMRDLKIRWVELRADLWTKEYIFGIINKMYNQIQDVLEIDLEMWKPITVEGYVEWELRLRYSNEEFDLDEAIQFLFDWIEERLDFCDEYFRLN